jgi:hypothetical protein
MVFDHPNKKNIQVPRIKIEDTFIEQVTNFNLLGLTLDKHVNWKVHIDKIVSKVSKTIGILNRIKHFLPLQEKLTIYNSLISSHLNFGILAWGNKCSKLLKLQKKAIRIITLSKYNAHSEPLLNKTKYSK